MTSPFGKFLRQITVPTGGYDLAWDSGGSTAYALALDYMQGWDTTYNSDRAFDWTSGEGTSPSVGPTLTAGGSPTAGKATPWQDSGDTALTCSHFDGDDYYYSGTATDPGATEDAVVVALFRAIGTGLNIIAATRTVGNPDGWQLNANAGGLFFLWSTDSGSTTHTVTSSLVSNAWYLVVIVVDRDGNITSYLNGTYAAQDATASGACVGAGIAIAALPDQSNIATTLDVYRVQAYYAAAGLAGNWDATYNAKFAAKVFGTWPTTGSDATTFARAGSRSYTVGSNVHILSPNMPAAGGSPGYVHGPAVTNECYNAGPSPAATTGWTLSGGTSLTTVDDSSQLETDGLRELGPDVFKLDCSAAGGTAINDNTTGNTTDRVISIWMRGDAGGEDVQFGLDDDWGSYLSPTLTTSWQRFELALTPADSGQSLAVYLEETYTVYFIAAQMETDPGHGNASDWVPNRATAAEATKAIDALSYAWQHTDTEGQINCSYAPRNWDEGDYGDTRRIFTRASTDSEHMRIDDANAFLEITDGTNTCERDTAFEDGTHATLSTSWKTSGNMIARAFDGTDSEAYDGSFAGAGDTLIAAEAEGAIKDISHSSTQGGAYSVTVAAGDYATILELCGYLEAAMQLESGRDYQVEVSAVGIVTIATDEGDWDITWASTDDALSTILGFDETESVALSGSDYTLTSSEQHTHGWYPGTISFGSSSGEGHSGDTDWVPDWPMAQATSGSGKMRRVMPARAVWRRRIDFDLLTDDEVLDPATGLHGLLQGLAAPMRFYPDRDVGTVGTVGTQGDPQDDPRDSETDYWKVYLEPIPEWQLHAQSGAYRAVSISMQAEPD